MPYSIRRSGSTFQIVRKSDGTIVGQTKSMQKAQASIRARLAGERKRRKR